MSAPTRVAAEFSAARRAFLRRRTAVFFTFLFPLLLVVIFGALVRTDAGGTGLFTEPPAYYVAGYLAVVVLFTPLSRVGSEVARHREGNRFEKLATTPLTRAEWLLAQTLVNVTVVGVAGAALFALTVAVTGADVTVGPVALAGVAAFLALGTTAFCGAGALIGSLADSQDGVIAAANGVALPVLFLSETFVQPALLPAWLPTWLSPLTYFARGVRAATGAVQDPTAVGPLGPTVGNLAVLAAIAAVLFLAGAFAVPRTD